MKCRLSTVVLCVVSIGLAVYPSGSPGAADASQVPVSLQIDQPVVVGNLTLTLFGLSDSRCPRSVVCIWEGMVQADVRAAAPGFDPAEFTIYTHPKFGTQFTYAGHTITMVDVSPYPETPDPIDPHDYVVRVNVTQALGTLPAEETSWGRIKALFSN